MLVFEGTPDEAIAAGLTLPDGIVGVLWVRLRVYTQNGDVVRAWDFKPPVTLERIVLDVTI